MLCFRQTNNLFIIRLIIYIIKSTHGYIFKIIDFGRSIFTYHNKLFFNDTFYKHSEAGGQYTRSK